jgi:hypothetical protein
VKRLRKIGRWIAERSRDLWYGPGNLHAELGRVLATLAILTEVGGALWNMLKMHQAIDLSALGLGLAGILTASAGYLVAKAWSTTQAQVARTLQAKQRLDEKECDDAK